MTKKIFFISILMIAMAGAAFAQLPPGKWWRQPDVVNTLQLSSDQQDKLEAVFRGSANELIDLKADVEKQQVALRGELDQPQLNKANIQKVATKLNDARGRLFLRELTMLADMRAVLTDAQWNRMRDQIDNMQKPPKGRRDGMGPNGQPRPDGMGPGNMQPRRGGQQQPPPPGDE